jgi:hypothetical protein
MAETSIPVQPAAAQGAIPAAPLPLKMVQPSDASGTEIQAVSLFDDQGRAVYPLTEATGQKIVQLLSQLVSLQAQATGALLPSDDAATLTNPT